MSTDESDDDILTVKRAGHDIAANDALGGDDDDGDELVSLEPKIKVVTKAALAKKVMKKKILSNQVRRVQLTIDGTNNLSTCTFFSL